MDLETLLPASSSRFRIPALALFASLSLAGGRSLLAQSNTEYDVISSATDLTVAPSYNTGGPSTTGGTTPATTPPSVSSDVTFDSGVTYASPSGFTLDSSETFGSLNDLNATAITISDTGGAATTLTLGGTGDNGDEVSGSNSADLLYVATAANLTLTGGSGTTALGLVLGQSGNFDIAGTAAISSVISGGFSITKTGAGTLTLSGANTFSGGSNLSAGTVSLTSASGLGTGAVAIGASGTLALGIGAATLNNAISGAGTLTVTGTSETYLGGSLSGFTGMLNVQTTGGGKLDIVNGVSGATINIGTTANSATVFIPSTTTFANDTFNLTGTGNSENLGALRIEGGATIASSSTINLLSNSELGGNGAGTIAASITGVGFGFVKEGSGTLTLSGANTFSGTTTSNGGTLNLSNALALQNSTVSNFAPVFDQSVNGNAFTLGALSGGTALTLANNASTPVAITLTVGGNNASTVYSGVLSGAGSLIKAGTGSFEFTGTNTFTGNLTVANGVLYTNGNSTYLTNSAGTGTVTLGASGASNNTVISLTNTARTFANPIVTQGTGGSNTIQVSGGNQGFTFSGGVTLGNNFTFTTVAGTDSINESGAIGGTGNLETSVSTTGLGGNSTGTGLSSGGTITLNGGVNNTGTVTNDGNGSAATTINGVIGANVTGVVENSATSSLALNAANTFNGTLQVQNGTVALGSTSTYLTSSGGTGTVTLGAAGAANTTAITFSNIGRTFSNPIATAGTGGTNTLQSSGGGQTFTFSGAVTLGNNLTLSTAGTAGNDSDAITMTGGFTGTGNLVTQSGAAGTTGGGLITISGAAVNNTGTITNSGTATTSSGTLISANIGASVTGLIENSAGSPLSLSGTNTFTGPATISAGILSLTSTGSIRSALVQVSGSTSVLTLANSTALAAASTLTMTSGSTLNLNAPASTTQDIGMLILDGHTEPAGTFNSTQLESFDPNIMFTSLNGETLTISVPEPSAWIAVLLSLCALGFYSRSVRRTEKC